MKPADIRNDEAEAEVLGAAMLDPESFSRILRTGLQPEHFHQVKHKVIFKAMVELHSEGQEVTAKTVYQSLIGAGKAEHCGGVMYLVDLVGQVPSAASDQYFACKVMDAAALRNVSVLAHEVDNKAHRPGAYAPDALAEIEKTVAETTLGLAPNRHSGRIGELLPGVLERFEAAQENKVGAGTPTGFIDLDRLTGGLQPGQMTVLAGRPSAGKTTFSMNIAENIAVRKGIPVLFCSLEVGIETIVENLSCSVAGVEVRAARQGRLGDRGWQQLAEATEKLSSAALEINANPSASVVDITLAARQQKARNGLGLVIVDYLQLVRIPYQKDLRRHEEVAAVSRGLKALSIDLKVPVIAISQLSRASEKRDGDKRPRLSDLRESGSIEQDADVVVFLYRDRDAPATTTQAIVAKNRHGPTGIIDLAFSGRELRFKNMTRDFKGAPTP